MPLPGRPRCGISAMLGHDWRQSASPAFRLMIATSWLAPDSWKEKQEKEILEASGEGLDWTEYLFLVDRHRIPALSWAAIGRVPDLAVPDGVRQELQRRSDGCRMRAIHHSLLLAQVLKRLNRDGIPVMPCKGPVLSFNLYGDVGLRQFRDLDVAVAESDLEQARASLEDLGWRVGEGNYRLSPRQWESFLRNEYEMVFEHPQTNCILELQWSNQWETPEVTRARWARSTPSEWQGCSIREMNSGDLMLYLCSHGGHHAWFRAKWLGDVARAHAMGLPDWDAAFHEARKAHRERVLEVGLALLEQLYGLPAPEPPPNPRTRMPALLVEIPFKALRDTKVPTFRTDLGFLRYRLRMSRYERMLSPRKAWRRSLGELFHFREDFRTVPLPDWLFWLYRPLRPFLWLLRLVRQAWQKPPIQSENGGERI